MPKQLFSDEEVESIKKRLVQRVNAEIEEPVPNVRFLDVASKLIEALTKAISTGAEQDSIWAKAQQILEADED